MADTCPFLGPLVPLFWISGDVSAGFQSQSGFCLIRYFCGGKCNVHSPRFTSGATLANLLAAGAQLVTSPHACAEVGLGSDSNVQLHEQKTNALPLCQRPSSLRLRLRLKFENTLDVRALVISIWSLGTVYTTRHLDLPFKIFVQWLMTSTFGIVVSCKYTKSCVNISYSMCHSYGFRLVTKQLCSILVLHGAIYTNFCNQMRVKCEAGVSLSCCKLALKSNLSTTGHDLR